MHFFRLWQLIILGIVAVAAIGLFVFSEKIPTSRVQIKGKNFTMLRADTPERWKKGLSGRNSLGKYDGMIFLFPDNLQRPLVMREMKFPIDVIWISNSNIVDMKIFIEPEPDKLEQDLTQYLPRIPAEVVLEVPAGFVELNSLQIGDKIELGQ